jgi:hypothetical protein
MRLKLICCEILFREVCAAVAASPHRIDLEFAPKSLHDRGAGPMRDDLQRRVADADTAGVYSHILLGYGLCNHGAVGITAANTPLVIPRAHDCITLFLGAKERYQAFFDANPGTYFHTCGWLERAESDGESLPSQLGINLEFDQLVERYGRDNAEYIAATLGQGIGNYSRLAYISMGVGPEAELRERSRRTAAEHGWEFREVRGDMSLIQRLVNGDWHPADFLVIPPGRQAAPSYDQEVVAVRHHD